MKTLVALGMVTFVLYFVTVGALLFLCAPYAFTVVASVLVGHWVIKNV